MITEILTPTWQGVLPIYLRVLENPKATSEARNAAQSELERMAHCADLWNKHTKEKNNRKKEVILSK